MTPERKIRLEELAGTWRYFVPLHVLVAPIVRTGRVTTLGDHRGWNSGLSIENNETAYAAVQAINAINGVRVIDITHLSDDTSQLNILVGGRAPEDVHARIVHILQDNFNLNDCTVVVPPLT